MVVGGSFPLASKRRRLTNTYSSAMDSEAARAKLAAMTERYGREFHVFETSTFSPSSNAASSDASQLNVEEEETDDLEFSPEDYIRISSIKKPEPILKTRKMREAEAAARKSKMTRAVIRVRFPDNHTLEATFDPSETIQTLIDLLIKVIAQPEQPFYIYTVSPKKLITNMSQDFYAAGFCPGALVNFSYDVSKGGSAVDLNSPYLREEILSLKGSDAADDQGQQSELVQSEPEPVEPTKPPTPVQEQKPAQKKLVKPKWLKM
uniref:UBX domain-containing protein n=1 Tax=Lotus japonicus TaxID=34305 RepID=I3SRL4_LOTJA|nr:unknown [Lotus japonicus]